MYSRNSALTASISRRGFLGGALLAPMALAARLQAEGTPIPKIRITGVKAHHLTGKLKQRFGWSLNWTDTRQAVLVEVTTDAGLTGWGDGAYAPELLSQDKHLVIGRSPFEVESIFESLRPPARGQSRMGPPAGGGLDVALWDIVGQALGRPVCELLGHVYRTRVEPYCTALYRKDWPDLAAGLAEEARGWKERGFKSMKMKIGYGPEIDVEIVRAVRKAIGNRSRFGGGRELRLRRRHRRDARPPVGGVRPDVVGGAAHRGRLQRATRGSGRRSEFRSPAARATTSTGSSATTSSRNWWMLFSPN